MLAIIGPAKTNMTEAILDNSHFKEGDLQD